MTEWKFPSNNFGRTDGFNDASIDTFNGKRLASLVRETIQNSMDAVLSESDPVFVSFTCGYVKKSETHGVPELVHFLKMAREAAKRQSKHHSEDPGTKFYDNAVFLLENSDKVPFFGIHDFNTTGLSGPTDNTDDKVEEVGPWLALVKGSGQSVKLNDSAGGSFGHGSKAPFGMSQLRTVFYLSEVFNGAGAGQKSEKRFQGKSILQSMKNSDSEGYTQGTGYFGHRERLTPLKDSEIPQWVNIIRDAAGAGTGTSILIPFPESVDSLEDFWIEIQKSVLTNFYYSILKGRLKVSFGNDESIEGANLQEVMNRLCPELDADESPNFRIPDDLRSAFTIQNPDISGTFESEAFGQVEWFMRLGENINSRTVGIARQNGMLITRKPKNLSRFQGTKTFDLFLCVSGDKGAKLLRSVENPAHDAFEFDRINDPKERREKANLYDSFTKEIKALILEYASVDASAEVYISDLDELFGAYNNSSEDAGNAEKSGDLFAGKPRRILFSRGTQNTHNVAGNGERPGTDEDGNPAHVGRGHRSDERSQRTSIDENKEINIEDPRYVRRSKEANIYQIYFTPTFNSPFVMSLIRSGEDQSENVKFRVTTDASWATSLKVPGCEAIERMAFEVELPPEESNYVHEVVISLAR